MGLRKEANHILKINGQIKYFELSLEQSKRRFEEKSLKQSLDTIDKLLEILNQSLDSYTSKEYEKKEKELLKRKEKILKQEKELLRKTENTNKYYEAEIKRITKYRDELVETYNKNIELEVSSINREIDQQIAEKEKERKRRVEYIYSIYKL